MKWSVGTKIGGGFALALAILVVIGAVAYRSSTRLIETAERVAHTHIVLEDLQGLLSDLKDAETGQRGYIITGEEAYLEPYHAGTVDIDQKIKDLRSLTADNPNQQQRLNILESKVATRTTSLKEGIAGRKEKGFEAARQFVLTGRGKKEMDEIRKAVAEMENEERDLLKQRTRDAEASVQSTKLTIILGTLFSFALLSLVALIITQNISRPLQEISTTAERIALGDLLVNVAANNNRRDEVGTLMQSFARMTQSLQEMARVAERIAGGDLTAAAKPQSERDVLGAAFTTMVENLRRVMQEIREGVNVLASSASEIMAATTQVASGAAETATAVSQTTTTVEEVKQTAQVSSQKAKQVSESAQKSAQVAQTGKKSVEEAIDKMNRIQGQMESIADSIVRLSEQSQAIGEIVATVNDLAEQSNLLAVNASIEAAKAGEQGKGFAVVAQEVKSLAEQSKQATAQVRNLLNDIQKATSAAVMATEQGSKAVEAGVKQSTEAGESIRMLSENIGQAAQASTQIAASSQQQLVGMDQVALAMENIKQASTQNVASTKQAEASAEGLHNLGQKLKQLVEQHKV